MISFYDSILFSDYSYASTTGTTNLTIHLLHKHDIEISSANDHQKQRKINDVFFPNDAASTVKRKQCQAKDNTPFIFFRQIVLWFCRDLLPLSTVEKSGFNGFWKYLNGMHRLPSRSTVSISALDDLYLCCKNKLIERLTNSTSHATITFDGWSDRHKRISYFTYTYHYMESWKMKSVVLKTAMFAHPHTSQRIKEDFESTLAEFNVLNKKISVVTDGAASMIKASELLSVYRFYCIGHIVHLLVRIDLMQHKNMAGLRALRMKLRKIHRKLIYKHEELCTINDEATQLKILSLMEEHQEICTYFIK